MDVFDLFAKLSLDTSQYEKGLNDAETKGSKFGSGLRTAAKVGISAVAAVGTAAVAGAKQFVDAAGDVAEYGDSIDKMSQKIGISAEAYQEWDFIAQHSGTSMESLKTSFKTLANAAQDGKDEFAKLGISMDDVASMSTEELFSAVISGLQGMEEGTERTAIASKLLGRGAIELGALLNTSAEDTEAMKKQVHDLGGVMGNDAVKASARYQDSLQNVQTAMGGLKNNLMGQFLPAFADVMDGLSAIFTGDDSGAAKVNEGINNIVTNIVDGLPKVLEVGGQILSGLAGAIMENLPKIAETAGSVILTLTTSLMDDLPDILAVGVEIIGSLAKSIGDALPTLVPAAVETIISIVEYLLDNIDQIIDAGISIIMGLGEGLINALPQLIAKIPEIIVKLVGAIITSIPKIIEAGFKLILGLGEGIINGIPELLSNVGEIGKGILDVLASLPGKLFELGAQVIGGFVEGIGNFVGGAIDAVGNFFGGIVDGVAGFLGIHSPSRVFAELGQFSAEGFGVGFDDEFSDVKKDIEDNMAFDAPDMDFGTATYSVSALGTSSLASTGVASTNDIASLLQIMINKLDNINGQQIVLDTGVLVGQTVGKMDMALGGLANKNARGVLA